jgi:hypothetical protein
MQAPKIGNKSTTVKMIVQYLMQALYRLFQAINSARFQQVDKQPPLRPTITRKISSLTSIKVMLAPSKNNHKIYSLNSQGYPHFTIQALQSQLLAKQFTHFLQNILRTVAIFNRI